MNRAEEISDRILRLLLKFIASITYSENPKVWNMITAILRIALCVHFVTLNLESSSDFYAMFGN